MHKTIRPAKPLWETRGDAEVAQTALGLMSVEKSTDGLWRAYLNDGYFPILYQTIEQARKSGNIILSLKGQPTSMPADWIPNSTGGETAEGLLAKIHIAKSDAIEGFFLMDGDDPASIPLSDKNQAKEACAQYLAFVWFSLSEIS
jgi:hypothetical protein